MSTCPRSRSLKATLSSPSSFSSRGSRMSRLSSPLKWIFRGNSANASDEELTPPGSCGSSLFHDDSLEFVTDPVSFLRERSAKHGPIFMCRILNRPTVIVGSNAGIKELLEERWESFHTDLMDHVHELYGDNIIFADSDELMRLRRVVAPLFNVSALSETLDVCKLIIRSHVTGINCGTNTLIYPFFKRLATELSLSLFLGLDAVKAVKEAEDISKLAVTHWRGIVSVPLKINSIFSSTYGKAGQARDSLLDIIRAKLMSSSVCPMGHDSNVLDGFQNTEEAARHLLLFISALIPKAFASLLTSFTIELSKDKSLQEQCLKDEAFLEDTLLEVIRLWPAFLGSRKIATEDVWLGGYLIKKDTAVVYMTHGANKDELVFPHAEQFDPSRWRSINASDKASVFTFGAGGRSCVGQALVELIFKETAKALLEVWQWQLPAGQDLAYKWLPVSRPKADIAAVFTKRP